MRIKTVFSDLDSGQEVNRTQYNNTTSSQFSFLSTPHTSQSMTVVVTIPYILYIVFLCYFSVYITYLYFTSPLQLNNLDLICCFLAWYSQEHRKQNVDDSNIF